MTTAFSNLLGLALPVTGELSGTWGDTVNDYITKYLDDAIANAQIISGSQTAVTLSKTTGSALASAGSGATGSAQYALIRCTGNPASTLTITVSYSSLTNVQFSKTYLIFNSTSTNQSVVVQATTSSGTSTGVTITSGEKALIAWNGTDFVKIATQSGTGEFVTVDTTNLEVTNIKAKDGTAAATIADSTGAITVSTLLNVDNLRLDGNTLSSTDTNGNIVLAPNGTGDVQLDADTVRVGDSNVNVTITSNGTADLILNTNAGTNSGAITIQDGVDGNIIIAPNGNGQVQISNAALDLTTIEVTNIKAKDGTASMTLADSTGVVTFSANPVLNAGTANGVPYLSSPGKVLTTGSALTFDGTNFTTPRTQVTTAGTPPASGAGFEIVGGTTPVILAYNRGTSAYLPFTQYGSAFTWSINAVSSDLVLTSTGLGIGTSSPATKLEVSGTSSGATLEVLRLSNNGAGVNTQAQINFASASTSYASIAGGYGASAPQMTFNLPNATAGNYIWQITSSEQMRLTSTGLKSSIAGTNADPVFSYTSDTNTGIFFPAADKLGFTAGGGSDQMVLTSTGLGIGTSSPAVKLDVNSSAAAVMRLTRDNGTAANTALQYFNGSVSWFAGMSASGLYSIGYNDAALDSGAFRLDSSGNLGLGVTPSTVNTLSGFKSFEIGQLGNSIYAGNNQTLIGTNVKWDGTTAKYAQVAANYAATLYNQQGGAHQWFNAASGTAGDPITFIERARISSDGTFRVKGAGTAGSTDAVQFAGTAPASAMTLDASGNLGIGDTSPSSTLSRVSARGPYADLASGYGTILAGSTDSQAADKGGTLSFTGAYTGATATIFAGIKGAKENSTDGNFAGYLSLWTRTNGSTPAERARITSVGGFETKPAATGHAVFNEDGVDADFRVEGDTDTHLIFADASTDRVGIGTNNPGYKLDVNGTFGLGTGQTGNIGVFGANSATADTYFRLRNTAGAFDIGTAAGGHYFYGQGSLPLQFFTAATEAGRFSSDGTFRVKGAGTAGTTDAFQVAGTAPADAARITSDGNLLVGTTSALIGTARKFSVDGTNNAAVFKNSSAASETVNIWNSATSGDNAFVDFDTETSVTSRGSITYNRAGGLVAYNTTSDYRAKVIIGPVQNSGQVIDALKVYEGVMKGATQSRPMLVAHEAQEHAPYAVTGEKDAVNEDGTPKYQQMDVSSLMPLLLAEIQSLRARVAQLESKGA